MPVTDATFENFMEYGMEDISHIDDWFDEFEILVASTEDDVDISFDYDATVEVEYLISPDKETWWGYNGTEWVEGYHMTKMQLESLTGPKVKQLTDRLHKVDSLYYKAVLFSNTDTNPILENITTKFLANQPPYILDPAITLDGEYNNHAEVTGKLIDLEGDDIEYRILIQKAGENNYYIADPNDNDGWVKKQTGEEILRGYSHEYFNEGENKIKIELKDERGLEGTAWVNTFVLMNEDPIIQNLSKSDFHVEATISDEYDYPVDYQLSINGIIVREFKEYKEGPITFRYEWDNEEINIGEMNTFLIEAKDELEGYSTYEFEFLGQELGLFIVDSNNDLYTNLQGEILQHLDKGQIIAGQNTQPKVVYLMNNTQEPLEEPILSAKSLSLPSNANVYLSKERDPFQQKEEILIKDGILENQETQEFFVRVDSKLGRGASSAEFIINAKGKSLE